MARSTVAWWFPVVLLGCGSLSRPTTAVQNVILISIDTLRADHLGCYGYERATSPALDLLAAGGVLFEEAAASAPYTVPSHASMLTGLYSRSHGMITWARRLPEEIQPIAARLSAQGFATAAMVNVSLLNQRFGFGRGFDEYFSIAPEPAGAAAATIVSFAKDWMQRHRGERFFLFLHFYDVHSDYDAPEEYRRKFVRPYAGRANGTTEQLSRYLKGRIGGWGEPDARHLADLYDASIRQLDDQLGPFFEELRVGGLWDRTLVIVTSDHGEELLEHGTVLHSHVLYQESLHVPLILAGADLPQGTRIPEPVSLVDITPTILALTGTPDVDGLDGVDLSRSWKSPAAWPPRRGIFSETEQWPGMEPGNLRSSVRLGRFKLLYDRLSDARSLFDLESDSEERVDIASSRAELLEPLWLELESYMQRETADAESLELSEEQMQRLRELGYAE